MPPVSSRCEKSLPAIDPFQILDRIDVAERGADADDPLFPQSVQIAATGGNALLDLRQQRRVPDCAERLPIGNAAVVAKQTQDGARDQRIVDRENEAAFLGVPQGRGDAEDRSIILMRLFENRGDAHRVATRPLHGEDFFEHRLRRGQHVVEEQVDFRSAEAAGAASDEDVAFHGVRVSVIIPSLNEAASIGAAIDSAAGAEVIVTDGGSTDDTIGIALARSARVVEGESMRARQMNRAAAVATGEALIFLHADTILPAGALDGVRNALENGCVFGGFRIAFVEPGLDGVARAINVRTRWTRAPWGDQAQFIRRDAFLEGGGFREIPIMEDYELARRMKRAGATTILPLTVRTSGRRFLQKGLVRTAVVNWTIILAYHLGISPQRLARWYR